MSIITRRSGSAKWLLTLCAGLTAGACDTRTPPPAIQYDSLAFKEAVLRPDPPKPITVVKVPELLPLPGQMMPLPRATATDGRSPKAKVDDANKAALLEPSAKGFVNAVQNYPYDEGALYRLYAAPENVSDIALQAGETLIAVSAGDTVRWIIGNTTSGEGDTALVHILVKPFAAGLKTNMVITTSRRAYHLALESTEATAMAAVSWSYPQDQLIALRSDNAHAEAAAPVASGLSLGDLHFRYAITGDTPPWRPLRAFDDGSKVYIEFPDRIDQGEVPPLFVVGADGGNELVNYRVRQNYYIVDRLFGAAELRLGSDPQQVVRISRDDGDHRTRSSDPSPVAPSGREDR